MKILRYVFVLLCIFGLSLSPASWAWFGVDDGAPAVRYCNDGEECGLEAGIDAIQDTLGGIENDRSASEYIQDVIRYLLTFISIIAVIYIIYAGFQILIWSGDEEKLKKSRQTIVYVIIGIVVIWLSWPITRFILSVLNG